MSKVAFVKYGGLAAGGTEIFLQTLAVNLSNRNFEVDYFYCDSTPYIGSNWKHPDTDKFRKQYLEQSKVNLIKFNVKAKDLTSSIHKWVETDFWEKFSEDKYDLLISARAGHPEYPFIEILNIPMINFVTLNAGVDNQKNIYKTVLISDWAAKQWVASGGDKNRLMIIPLIREFNYKASQFEKNTKKFTFGFHQRDNDEIFSEVPLLAYKKIMSENTEFIILGGSKKYSNQAKGLKLTNFKQLKHTGDELRIHKFLSSLNVFSHGRNDGETFGLVFVEAMYHNLPIISHEAQNNAQIEVIGNAGKVFNRNNILGYATEMFRLKNNKDYYSNKASSSRERYNIFYSLEVNLDKIINLIKQAIC